MVDDVFAALDAYQVEQCVLAAESMGAVTAFLAALQQPHRFQGLVIVDGLFSRPAPTDLDPFVEGLRHNFEATIGQFVDALPEQIVLHTADGAGKFWRAPLHSRPFNSMNVFMGWISAHKFR